MPRKTGTPNTPQIIIDEINKKHKNGRSLRELAIEYEKPFKTIGNMTTRENNKKRRRESGQPPKTRGVKRRSHCKSINMKTSDYEWRMRYFGIFFISLEGGKAVRQISGNISKQRKISRHSYVSIFRSVS